MKKQKTKSPPPAAPTRSDGGRGYPVALLISRIFDPVWLIPVMLAIAVGWSVMNGLRWRFLVLLIAIDGFIPFLYFVHLLRTKEISDWDTTKRTERFRLYGFTVAVHAIGVLFALLLGKVVLAKILFSFLVLALTFLEVTFRWKISLHTGVSSAAVVFLMFVFGFGWIWLFFVVFLIGWARVAMKKHTRSQAIAGALLAGFLLLGMFRLLGIAPKDARAPSQVDLFFSP